MKKIWVEATVEALDMKETAHGVEAPFVEDSQKWTCNATAENPCEAGHTKPGVHGTWGSADETEFTS